MSRLIAHVGESILAAIVGVPLALAGLTAHVASGAVPVEREIADPAPRDGSGDYCPDGGGDV